MPAKPHIIQIAYFFPPDGLIGGARPYRFQKYLKRAGYTCDVITAAPQGPSPSPDVYFVPDPLNAVWNGPQKASISLRGHIERLIRRTVFPGELGIMWSLDAAAVARSIIALHPGRPVAVVSSFPPIGAFLAGLWIASRHRVCWISDLRDPMSIDPAMRFLPARTRLAMRLFEAWSFRKATAIVANVEGAGAIFRDHYPRQIDRLHVIYNGYDPDDISPPRGVPVRERRQLVHTGTIYEGRNPDVIVSSIARLRRQGNMAALSVELLFVGDIGWTSEINRSLYEDPVAEGWVRFHPRVPKPEAQRITEEADGLMLLQPQSDIQVPGKLFEYVCIGRPILGLAPRGSAVAEILERSGIPCVCLYTGDDSETVDRKILQFLAIRSTPARPSEWFLESFDAARQATELASIIESANCV